jgi:diguanylate cyclase (GGDEF)-like protein
MTKRRPQWSRVPAIGVALTVLALAVPVLYSTTTPDDGNGYEALLWLAALIPAFLLAHYRGRRWLTLGFAAAMVALAAAQLAVLLWGLRLPDWPVMLALTASFIGLSILLTAAGERARVARAVRERLYEALDMVESLVLSDAATSLPTRRHFDLVLNKDFAAARRGLPLALVVFELDGFDAFTERHGGEHGGALLRGFGRVLASNTRGMDLSARVNGATFMSLATGSDLDGALIFVDRVRDGLRQLEGLPEPATLCAGVAAYTKIMTSPGELKAAANAALRRAQRTGTDEVTVAWQGGQWTPPGWQHTRAYSNRY